MTTIINKKDFSIRLLEAFEYIKCLPDTAVYILGVSGGKDSMLLLELFRLADKKVHVAHMNYGLRDEATQETCVVRQYCLTHQLRSNLFFCRQKAATHGNFQQWARKMRYGFFEKLSAPYGHSYIVTAHHFNDQVETFWLKALRGTSTKGLSGIQTQTDKIIRPLLEVSQVDINQAVDRLKLNYAEDSSNTESKYRRNWLRLDILPRILRRFPDALAGLEVTMKHQTQTEQFIREELRRWKSKQVWTYDHYQLIRFDHHGYSEEFLLSRYLHEHNFNEEQINQVLHADHTGLPTYENDSYLLQIYSPYIIIKKRQTQTEVHSFRDVSDLLNSTDIKAHASANDLEDDWPNDFTGIFDLEQLCFPLFLKTWEKGMKMTMLGQSGHQLVSDVLTNQKVPRITRSEVPILVNDDGEVLWIPGIKRSNLALAKKDSKELMRITLRRSSFPALALWQDLSG